jgi:hypothetical protein
VRQGTAVKVNSRIAQLFASGAQSARPVEGVRYFLPNQEKTKLSTKLTTSDVVTGK